jgi:hypothetical protein
LDPHLIDFLDPDPDLSKSLDPDPHMSTDPKKHCFKELISAKKIFRRNLSENLLRSGPVSGSGSFQKSDLDQDPVKNQTGRSLVVSGKFFS